MKKSAFFLFSAFLIFSFSFASAQTLQIFCGAGMAKPFQEIVAKFQEASKITVEVSYANAGQIQAQINTAQEGDLFVAGSVEELKAVEKFVSSQKDLTKHVPVLAVKKGNPLGVQKLQDLTKLRLALADAKSTPIGKIADKLLADAKLLESVNIISRTTTAPALATALELEECDAIIVWKENVNLEKMDIVELPEIAKQTKTIPAATLSFSKNQSQVQSFLQFLDTDQAKNIWLKHGYELLN